MLGGNLPDKQNPRASSANKEKKPENEIYVGVKRKHHEKE